MKMYDYLIAYKCFREGFIGPVDGSVCISRKNKIRTSEDIADIVKAIVERDPIMHNVGIYNIILLGRNKH